MLGVHGSSWQVVGPDMTRKKNRYPHKAKITARIGNSSKGETEPYRGIDAQSLDMLIPGKP